MALTALLPLALLLQAAAAPPGAWTCDGGSPAGAGVATGEPLREAPALAWTYEAQGTIAAEPLVWGRNVVLDVRTARAAHTLVVLDLADGRPRASLAVPAEDEDLAAALWDGVLALRPAPGRIELLRLVSGRPQALRTLRATRAGAPLLVDGELYYADGDALVCQETDEREPRWRARPGGVPLGRPRADGEHVFTLCCDARGTLRIVALTRAHGEPVSDVALGRLAQAPDPALPFTLALLEDAAFALSPLPFAEGAGGQAGACVRVGRRAGLLGGAAGGASLHALLAPPLAHASGWIALDATAGGAPRWLASAVDGAQTRSIVLADGDDHAHLLACRASASRARDVLYLDDLGVAADDLRVLWRSGRHPRLRPVPVERGLLVVEGAGRLVLLREPPRAPPPAAAEAERLARRSAIELGEGLAALALRAASSDGRALAPAFLEEAERRGAGERSLGRAREALERPARPRTRPDEGAARAALLAERERLLGAYREHLLDLARGARDAALARALLARLVAEAPDAPGLEAALRALLPAGAPVAAPFDASSWLEFLAADAERPVRFVLPGADPRPAAGSGAAILARETSLWRPDLCGYASERLFVVTPPSRPGAVARALQVGELVCDALEDLLGARAGAAEPLVLFLYDTQAEYVAQSQRAGSRPELARGWSGGHFSADEGLSRMFVPPDDERSERLLGVYAHELTHHWLATRAPFAGGARARADGKGYWVAEGFATMVEEWRFLPEEHRWQHANERAESLDTLANARAQDLVPWEALFAATQEDFLRLDAEPKIAVSLAWRLGARGRVSPLRLFYVQAGATCHFLLRAENGRWRDALLRAVQAWSTGRPLDVQELTGLSPAELGRRVVAFAKAETQGG